MGTAWGLCVEVTEELTQAGRRKRICLPLVVLLSASDVGTHVVTNSHAWYGKALGFLPLTNEACGR